MFGSGRSVVDAHDPIRLARPPCHAVEVKVGHEVLGRPASCADGPEGLRDQVEDGRAGRGARLAVEFGEREGNDATCEAGAEGAGEIRRGGVGRVCHTRIVSSGGAPSRCVNEKKKESFPQ